MNYRSLLNKICLGPVYLFCEFEEVALKKVLVDGEMEVYIKYKELREFKAIYDSRLLWKVLSNNPVMITQEEYHSF